MRIPPDWQVGANGAILVIVLAARVLISQQGAGAMSGALAGLSPPALDLVVRRRRCWSGSAAIAFTGGYGAGGMLTAALSLAVFTVIVGVGQMFVITLGPGNVDLSLPANIGLASAVAMKTMGGDDSHGRGRPRSPRSAAGSAVGVVNYLLIWALRIPPIIATLSASFVIQSIDISYGRGLQIKPPPGFADFTNIAVRRRAAARDPDAWCSPSAPASRCTARSTAARCWRSARTSARRGWPGVKVEPMRFATYALCGTLGGLDGALLAGYFRGANVDIGNEYLLASIAVVVIGGTSVAGGKANVPGVWGGALFLVLLLTMLNTFGVSAGRAAAADRPHHRRRHHRRRRREGVAGKNSGGKISGLDVNPVGMQRPFAKGLGFAEFSFCHFGGLARIRGIDFKGTLANFQFAAVFAEHVLHEANDKS